MNRSANDPCLLCKLRPATKTNSHIAPKFLGKSMLGEEGPKKGFILDSANPHLAPKITQDSPKENFLFCPDCEKYFSVLETYAAEHFFKRLLNEKYKEDFSYGTNPGEIEYAYCTDLDVRLFRLFIISLFWRCSVAIELPFSRFKISNEEQLRLLLMESFTTDIKLPLTEFDQAIYQFPIVVIRPSGDIDHTRNVFYPNKANEGLSQLLLNEYCAATLFG